MAPAGGWRRRQAQSSLATGGARSQRTPVMVWAEGEVTYRLKATWTWKAVRIAESLR